MTRPIAALDVPLPVLEADAAFMAAAARTNSPSDRLAFLLDAQLVHHPEVCATDDSYPGFAEWVADREASNRRARRTK